MTIEEYKDAINNIRKQSLDVLEDRTKLYTGDDDPLYNFHVGADIAGSTPAQCAWMYMTKHLSALRRIVTNNDFSDMRDVAEKCSDIINYTSLIYTLAIEASDGYKHVHLDNG